MRRNKAELLFAVILPDILLPFLENLTLDALGGPIHSKIEKTSDIKDLLTSVDFDNLTYNIIKNLNSKKVF